MTQPHPHAVHRSWDRDYSTIVRTDGVYLYDDRGRRYIDATGGSSVVVTIGHGVQAINDVMYEQSKQFNFYPAHAFSNKPFQDLSDLIVSLAPGGLKDASKVWITCTGTDATDDAVRLARQYWAEKGRMSKYLTICRWQAFHGNNIAVAGFSGLTQRRAIFAPMFIESPHIPPAYCYRCHYDMTYPSCGLKCARALESTIRQVGPDNVMAFIAEPVVGAALGAVPAPDGYFQVIREICDKYDVLFISDEVMTCFGRTGKLWGIEHWGVTPDIIAAAKGMSSGYTPLSAIIAKDSDWQPLIANNTPNKAGHTLNANAVSSAGGIAVINYLLQENLVQRCADMGAYMLEQMKEKLLRHRIVGDVRGKGLMVGFEMVQDKATKAPFDAKARLSGLVEKEAFARGVITYACTGTVDGVLGDMTLLAPPLIINKDQVDEIVHVLDESLSAIEAKL